MVKWNREYEEKGLSIIAVYTSYSGNDKDGTRKHVLDRKVTYPVLWDARGKVSKEYGIKAYPSAFLIGADGKVVWEGILPGSKEKLAEFGKLIEKEVKKGKGKKED